MKRFLVLLAMVIPASAALPACKTNPKIVAACYSVHARARAGADTVRIYLWPVGTKRMLGVAGGPVLDDAIEPILPRNLSLSEGESVYGDFEVCPFTPERKGDLQLVCIESATHLVKQR